MDQGATETGDDQDMLSEINIQSNQKYVQDIVSAFDRAGNLKRPCLFFLHNRGPRYNKVQLCGSMDNWQVRHDLQFDQFTNQWFINMSLMVGTDYLYKYVINDKHWVVNDEEPSKVDQQGNQNNHISVN